MWPRRGLAAGGFSTSSPPPIPSPPWKPVERWTSGERDALFFAPIIAWPNPESFWRKYKFFCPAPFGLRLFFFPRYIWRPRQDKLVSERPISTATLDLLPAILPDRVGGSEIGRRWLGNFASRRFSTGKWRAISFSFKCLFLYCAEICWIRLWFGDGTLTVTPQGPHSRSFHSVISFLFICHLVFLFSWVALWVCMRVFCFLTFSSKFMRREGDWTSGGQRGSPRDSHVHFSPFHVLRIIVGIRGPPVLILFFLLISVH